MSEFIIKKASSGGESEKPLVTFALFAYNQEKYIREAVESAFSQTYEPLEIIISDDCSKDRTFEIIKEMEAEYKGPHRLVVRQTAENRRPFAHVIEVSRMASGGLIVMAAGDDISKSTRVEKIANVWSDGIWGVHSRYDICDSSGHVVGENRRSEDLFSNGCELRRYFYEADGEIPVIHGATSAYDARLFNLFPEKCSDQILSEDGVLSVFLAAYEKPCRFIDDSLIVYRQHDEAITNIGGRDSYISLKFSRRLIDKDQVYAINLYRRAVFLLESLSAASTPIRPINVDCFLRDINFYGVKSRQLPWAAGSALQAIVIAIKDGKLGSLVPAILGPKLGSIYLFFSHNLKIIFRSLFSRYSFVRD